MSIALGEKEALVLRLAARGLTNRDIAKRLMRSEYTIHKQLRAVYLKLGVRCRTEAVVEGVRRGIVVLEGASGNGR